MIQIGTNIEYNGDQYLDYRQGHATSCDDLLNWNIPIPEGFEVYLNTDNEEEKGWYYYSETEELSETTGKFHKRATGGGGSDVDLTDVWNAICSLMDKPSISVTLSKDTPPYQNNENGATIYPKLKWNISKTTPYYGEINDSDITQVLKRGTTVINLPNYSECKSFIDDYDVTSNTTYTISVNYNHMYNYQLPGTEPDGVNVPVNLNSSSSTSYAFGTTKYKWIGCSRNPSISHYSDLQNNATTAANYYQWASWTLGWKMEERNINCDIDGGGWYIYYIFPTSLLASMSDFIMIVGGLTFTAYDNPPRVIEIQDPKGYTNTYYVIKTTGIQFGNPIRVEFGINNN